MVYDLNPLTPIDLTPFPQPLKFSHDDESRANEIQKLHKQVVEKIEKMNDKVKKRVDQKRKEVIFKEGDLVWLYLRKDMFPTKRKSKLSARIDGPFEILEKVNDNAYKLELPSSYGVSSTFNVVDLIPFHEEDMLPSLWSSFSKEGDDVISSTSSSHEQAKMNIMIHQMEDAQIQGPIVKSFNFIITN